MIKKILFSPIGGSDPVNAGYDGSWIHCCRHFKPDLTMVYISAEFLPREKNKKMFSGTLTKLNQYLGTEIQFRMEEKPDLMNPHDFGYPFYDDFKRILSDLHEEYPEAEIFINISSGTPAMKSSLTVLYHLLPYQMTLIQVSSMHDELGHQKGERSTVSNDYDVDEGWENDLDNLPDAINRCTVQEMEPLRKQLEIMQLKTLIQHHEYSAALTLATEGDLKDSLSENLIKALTAAVSRIQMDLYKTGLLFSGIGYEDGKMISAHYNSLFFQGAELFLTMEIDRNRDDVSSCMRKLTPVFFALIVESLAQNGVDILAIRDETKMFLDKAKFSEKYPSLYESLGSRIFNEQYNSDTAKMDSGNLIKIVKKIMSASDPLRKSIEELRDIEKSVRNVIAHQPVKMTEELYKELAKCSVDDTFTKIRKMFETLDPSLFGKKYWNSYDKMCAFILENVSIVK